MIFGYTILYYIYDGSILGKNRSELSKCYILHKKASSSFSNKIKTPTFDRYFTKKD